MEAPEQPTKCKACAAPIVQQELRNEDDEDSATPVYPKTAVKREAKDECDIDVKTEDREENENSIDIKPDADQRGKFNVTVEDVEEDGNEDTHENHHQNESSRELESADEGPDAEEALDDDEGPLQCTLCKEAMYCSEKCETSDFLSHRDGCAVKAQERVMAKQKKCFVCDKRIESEEVHCGTCGRIKYCSVACQTTDKKTHDLICGAYAELSPRPSKEHRICILFPADEQKPRLIWIDPRDTNATKTVVAPGNLEVEISVGPRIDPDDADVNNYRGIYFQYVESFLFHPRLAHNQSLGLAAIGRPLRSVRGSLLVAVSECSQQHDSEPYVDVTFGDLPAVVRRIRDQEAEHGFGARMSSYSRDSEGNLVFQGTTEFPLPDILR